MTAKVLDGKAMAADAREGIPARVRAVEDAGGAVRLDAIIACGRETSARVYADRQRDTCESLGIRYHLHELSPSASREQVLGKVRELNADPTITAVMVHMPVPAGIDEYDVKRLIDPAKDVEGVSPTNIGNIVYGRSTLAPCTGLATVAMIGATGVELRGKRVVVIGASATVGRPIAAMLMRREATVISCNKWTWGIEDLARSADILVVAVGRAGLVTADWVKPGAIVIDVGVNRVTGEDGRPRTVGDVVFDQVAKRAGWISPVPGGVGPLTVATLLLNVVKVAELACGLSPPEEAAAPSETRA